MENDSNLSIEELEKILSSNADLVDSENGDIYSGNSRNNEATTVKCLVCEKEFNSSDTGTDPINLFCGLCNLTLSSFPDRSHEITSRSSSNPMKVNIEKKTDEKRYDEDKSDEKNSDKSGDADKDNEGEDDNTAEPSDEENSLLDGLPSHADIYQQEEIPGYTGYKDGKELGEYFVAAKLAGDDCNLSLHIGNLSSLVFLQSRDPNNYAITGRQTFWKLSSDPYARGATLIMYGYDLYDAWLFGNIAIVCYCMIMGGDGFPIGNILFKIGRTRCATPRVDGFIYDIREDK
jgi:hypothetical protein